MKNSKELNASGYSCGIDQLGIKSLDLIKLNAQNNPKIKDVRWMKNLKELDSSYNSGIDQLGIKGLNLIKLYIWNNPKIDLKNIYYKIELNLNRSYQFIN